MPRRVHRDETRPLIFRLDVAQHDAAEFEIGGKNRRVGIDMHDVVVSGHRPVIADRAGRTEMDRLFGAQPLEIGPEGIGAEKLRIARMEFGQRRGIRLFACGALNVIACAEVRPVHVQLHSPRRAALRRWSIAVRRPPSKKASQSIEYFTRC